MMQVTQTPQPDRFYILGLLTLTFSKLSYPPQFCIYHSAKFHIDSKVILGCSFRINTTESSSHNLIQECATLHKSTQLTQLVGAYTRPWRGLPTRSCSYYVCFDWKERAQKVRCAGQVVLDFPSNLDKNLDFPIRTKIWIF